MKYFTLLAVCFSLFFAQCSSGQSKPAAESGLHHLVQEPKVLNEDSPLILLLHGYGSDEKDLFSLSGYFPENAIIVSVRAPLSLPDGGFCWFPLEYVDGKLVRDLKAVEKAGTEIAALIDQLNAKYKLKTGKVILVGFSQGAIMSYYMAMRMPEKIRAIAPLSGLVPSEFEAFLKPNVDLHAIPMFIGHGRKDQRIVFAEFEKAVRLFENKTSVTVFPFDGGHEIPNAEIVALIRWFNEKVLK